MQEEALPRKPRKQREERDPTPEQITLIAEYVRQKNALGHRQRDPDSGALRDCDLRMYLAYAKEIGFWRMKKDIEATAAMYARAIAPPVRHVGYPPSQSDPAPLYLSWRDYLNRVKWADLRRHCINRAWRANRRIMRLSPVSDPVRGYQVWQILCAARGRCMHCGSLAVEGHRRAEGWGRIGRRVGTLEHVVPIYRGGSNDVSNLAWSCMWCNHLDREKERKLGLTAWGALDSGGFYPSLEGEPDAIEIEALLVAKFTAALGMPWEGVEAAFSPGEVPPGLQEDYIEGEFLPDHEHPEATAMWRDTFG